MPIKLKSPYLKDPNRLADVIAAIQVLGTYRRYKLSFDGWADRISGDSTIGEHWRQIFLDHPEFFRLDSKRQRASLVWRRQYARRYQITEERKLSAEEYAQLNETERRRLSRIALTPADIKTLIDTAIDLHSQAVEAQREQRWWVALSGGLGGLIGAVAGALLRE